ncbi:MAG: hypothetical protein ABI442_01810 [Gemmatimonadaceae bacterium]
MNVLRVMQLMQKSAPFAAAAVVGLASAAGAQRNGQELFEWSGRVDREVQIVMKNGRVDTRDVGSSDNDRGRARVMSRMPREDGQVAVSVLNGRGNVDVIQQPDARNGYTTIIRIQDRAGGADNYRIATYWQGYANGDVGRRDRDDNRDRGRDYPGGAGYPGNNGTTGYPGNNGYPGSNNGGGRNATLLHWSGNVDGELEIRLQNGRVDYRTLSGAKPTSMRADLGNGANQRINGSVAVTNVQGRGSVNVIQQPSQSNGYTTVIRVRDPQGGYGYYNFDAMWQ